GADRRVAEDEVERESVAREAGEREREVDVEDAVRARRPGAEIQRVVVEESERVAERGEGLARELDAFDVDGEGQLREPVARELRIQQADEQALGAADDRGCGDVKGESRLDAARRTTAAAEHAIA